MLYTWVLCHGRSAPSSPPTFTTHTPPDLQHLLGRASPSHFIPHNHPGGNPGANLESISHKCYLQEVAFEWELTKETIHLPLGCLQGGVSSKRSGATRSATVSHTKCFFKSFCKSQLPCKSVNLFFISVNVKDKLTDLWRS
jgi:hypothetical protein